jgi:hypothetical protein
MSPNHQLSMKPGEVHVNVPFVITDFGDPFADASNISMGPLFCDPGNGDFTLHSNSPCAPGNHPDGYECGLIGALDVACGIGSVPETHVASVTWSQIKATYR